LEHNQNQKLTDATREDIFDPHNLDIQLARVTEHELEL